MIEQKQGENNPPSEKPITHKKWLWLISMICLLISIVAIIPLFLLKDYEDFDFNIHYPVSFFASLLFMIGLQIILYLNGLLKRPARFSFFLLIIFLVIFIILFLLWIKVEPGLSDFLKNEYKEMLLRLRLQIIIYLLISLIISSFLSVVFYLLFKKNRALAIVITIVLVVLIFYLTKLWLIPPHLEPVGI